MRTDYHMLCGGCSDADQLCRKCCKKKSHEDVRSQEKKKKNSESEEIEIGRPGWLHEIGKCDRRLRFVFIVILRFSVQGGYKKA